MLGSYNYRSWVSKYPEHNEFKRTLLNHEFLPFTQQEKILYNVRPINMFLRHYYQSDILCKIGLMPHHKIQVGIGYRPMKIVGVFTPCAIIHPSAFKFIVGEKNAVTVHKMPQEKRCDIAKILGINHEAFEKYPFTLIKGNKNGDCNKLDLIHEATHLIQNKSNNPTLSDEIEAFINETLVFRITDSNNFDKYIKEKTKEENKINQDIFNMLKFIWELTEEKDFWDVSKLDKAKWTQQFLSHNPMKNPI